MGWVESLKRGRMNLLLSNERFAQTHSRIFWSLFADIDIFGSKIVLDLSEFEAKKA